MAIISALTHVNLSSGFANNKGADQPAHPHSLISAFVIRLLESIITKLATNEISIFYLASVAEQASLDMTGRKPRRQVFSRQGPYKCSSSLEKLILSRGYKTFSCLTQLIMKFIMFINVKMLTIVGILTFISMMNTASESLKSR